MHTLVNAHCKRLRQVKYNVECRAGQLNLPNKNHGEISHLNLSGVCTIAITS